MSAPISRNGRGPSRSAATGITAYQNLRSIVWRVVSIVRPRGHAAILRGQLDRLVAPDQLREPFVEGHAVEFSQPSVLDHVAG
jgi:hypothetical protein